VLSELRQLHLSKKPRAWILHNVVPVISLGIYRLAMELGVPIIQWLHNYRPISLSGTLRTANDQLQPDDPWIWAKEIRNGTWHGRFLTAWLGLGYTILKWRRDFSSVRLWIAVSHEMRSLFVRAGWRPETLLVLHHAWDISSKSVSDADQGHFLFLGRMVETKGVQFLVDLWREPALASIPLVMAGQGPLAEQLSKTSPPNIRWVGHVDGEQKRELVRTCRGIVFPALWAEPLSTVAYEGYEMGKPVLASNVGGMKELVQDGQTGQLLQPGNAGQWRQAILRLAGDAVEARRLGLNGRRWLEQNVSARRWNEEFDAILAKLS
jgi:glycosyltransferase involved in cell wall biosynthesis